MAAEWLLKNHGKFLGNGVRRDERRAPLKRIVCDYLHL